MKLTRLDGVGDAFEPLELPPDDRLEIVAAMFQKASLTEYFLRFLLRFFFFFKLHPKLTYISCMQFHACLNHRLHTTAQHTCTCPYNQTQNMKLLCDFTDMIFFYVYVCV